ncbi:MAG: excinuclease ABC subunit UvrA [Gammaproteobacteria bacterium]|nr:excinuclease ABC subunit UvrA [Gammaproteobacteria bacterium]
MKTIKIIGARTHNLKNINLEIPRDKLIVITGLSGSGKSSLAFNTLYAEGQRRYVESLSAYARQFLSMMQKPDVDYIEGLSPAISIEQKSTSHNPRSTVGTITEIYDYLRLLFARVGQPRCPEHDIILEAQTISQMVDSVMVLPEDTKLMLLAPIVRERKGEYVQLFEKLRHEGFIRARIDGNLVELDQVPPLDLYKKHTIEVVIDRFRVRDDVRLRLAESFEVALNLADGLAAIAYIDERDKPEFLFSSKYACPKCGYSLSELEPRLFSFNNPKGACPACDGLGVKQDFDESKVIHNEDLSLGAGAIRGWDERNAYYYQMLESLAKHYHFDINKPFKALPEKIRQIILYGSGKEKIHLQYAIFEKTQPFEGIIPNMQRRYHETESEAVRTILSRYLTAKPCDICQGTRLRLEARHVFMDHKNIADITQLSIQEAFHFFEHLDLGGKRGQIAESILKEINSRLSFLMNVGLDYLTLHRSAETLSGGEAQRIRLASQIGAGLVGVMYVLDEPSIGLHQRDNARLLETLKHLRDIGNTVIVIEHDREAIFAADQIVDMGPGAGVHGGEIVAQGTPQEIAQHKTSLTGQYLSGEKTISTPKRRVPFDAEKIIRLLGVARNNLKNIDVEIPVGLMTCITGVSGSGKSSLVNDTLYPVLLARLNRKSDVQQGSYRFVSGLEHVDKVVNIDQSPIGRTPRSNPATYTGLFTPIRELFAATQEARSRGYQPGRFSFNVRGGRCEACKGDGLIKVEMHFLADIYVTCDVCHGKRYNRESLEIKYKGKNIYEVLEMTVEEAHDFFKVVPVLERKLQTLMDVGLSYIRLGQSATTLSGGEAQRIKLARELSKRDTGNTFYILDEPTTGLHFHDINQLLAVLHELRDRGNTVLIIEHNLDVIKTADWIIDLGPEGGDRGGQIVTVGTPEQVAKCKKSHTGTFLAKLK